MSPLDDGGVWLVDGDVDDEELGDSVYGGDVDSMLQANGDGDNSDSMLRVTFNCDSSSLPWAGAVHDDAARTEDVEGVVKCPLLLEDFCEGEQIGGILSVSMLRSDGRDRSPETASLEDFKKSVWQKVLAGGCDLRLLVVVGGYAGGLLRIFSETDSVWWLT